MKNQAKFDLVTLRAPKDDPEVGGDYYGLPWPCWGKPEIRHPGSHVLYNTALHVKDGGGTFRARFGTERNGETLLSEGSFSEGSVLTDGYPEFTMGVFKKLGWDKDLTPEEMAVIARIGGNNVDAVSWATDLSCGIQDRKSTRLNSSHANTSYAVICLKKIESFFARVNYPFQLGHDSADLVGVLSGCHAAHALHVVQARQHASAEVEPVELHLAWRTFE